MATELFTFQKDAVEWLSDRKLALLAFEMGLGKTAITISAIDKLELKNVLVLCPAVARANWRNEFKKFSSREWSAWICYSQKDAYSVFPISQPFLTICSYDLASKLMPLLRFDALILDESHYLKSVEAQRTHSVFGKTGLCRRSNRIWALSGTPAPNHPGELWPLLFTFGATKLSFDEFVVQYCTFYTHMGRRQITGSRIENIPELKKALSPFTLRKTKAEVMPQLPQITYEQITVDASPVDLDGDATFLSYVTPHDRRAELFQRLEQTAATLKAIVDVVEIEDWSVRELSEIGALKAMAAMSNSLSLLRHYTGVQKVPQVVELLRFELESNAYDKIVVFAHHQAVIEKIRYELRKFHPVTLYGKTPAEKRQRNVDRFQKEKKYRVFIGNILAAGTAVTLTAANQVLFVEQDWTPGNNAQAVMRCHRIGQTRPVTVRFVSLSNSIDEKIGAILKRKTRELTRLFDSPTQHVDNILQKKFPKAPSSDNSVNSELKDFFS